MYKCVTLLLLVFLSACTSMTPTENKEEADKVSTAKINTQLGLAYLERHDVGRAKQKLLRALKQAPNIPETWYSMAYFMEATGDHAEAKSYYQKAIAIAPTRGDAHNNYGTFLCRAGDYKTSIQQFLLATEDPSYLNSAEAYENAGFCAAKIPDVAQAKLFFAKALAQDPGRNISALELKRLSRSV